MEGQRENAKRDDRGYDISITSTPRPVASSTILRNSFHVPRKSIQSQTRGDEGYRSTSMTSHSSVEKHMDESSLGILENMSSSLIGNSIRVDLDDEEIQSKLDKERELARQLLKRCSLTKLSTPSWNESNRESNRLSPISSPIDGTPSTLVDSRQFALNSPNTPTGNESLSETRRSGSLEPNLVFEPREISARSSEFSRNSIGSAPRSPKKTELSGASGMDFMTDYENEEEFRSGSQMGSQLLLDEESWQQNCSQNTIPLPTVPTQERLELSCFSGIIGDFDLSLDSCSGRRVSIGEFFERKCGNLGNLSSVESSERPSFGLNVQSPQKMGKMKPLIDSTTVSEASYMTKEEDDLSVTTTDDLIPEDQSIMSLSSIAQVLRDTDKNTPRSLVDHLLNARKKKKQVTAKDVEPKPSAAKSTLYGGETFTIKPKKNSLSSLPSMISNEKSTRDKDAFEPSLKMSLDSNPLNDTPNFIPNIPRMLSFSSDSDLKKNGDESKESATNASRDLSKKSEIQSNSSLRLSSGDKTLGMKSPIRSPESIEKIEALLSKAKNLQVPAKTNEQFNLPSDAVKSPTRTGDNSFAAGSSNESKNVKIGKGSQDRFVCIAGVKQEIDLDISNETDHWLSCSLNLLGLRGDGENIHLNIPTENILISPNASKAPKIYVKVVEKCEPIIAILQASLNNIVTGTEWTTKHILCFIVEEPRVDVILDHGKEGIFFENLAQKDSQQFFLENKNSIDVSVFLRIEDDAFTVFFLEDKTNRSKNSERLVRVKSHEKCSIGIVFDTSASTPSKSMKFTAKLLISLISDETELLEIASIPLQAVRTPSLKLVNTEVPLVIPRTQRKTMEFLNTGTESVILSAMVVKVEENCDKNKSNDPTPHKDFSVYPDFCYLDPNTRETVVVSYNPQSGSSERQHASVQISSAGSVSSYPVIGDPENNPESNLSGNSLRCETPQYLGSASSPGSPHGHLAFNRSAHSGRNSPGSSVSGSTVAGDTIPIRATHTSLVWNSVKVGKNDVKEFSVRNTSSNKIKLKATIEDNENSFKFVRERQPASTSMTLVLQCMESKTLSVKFSPNFSGAATGTIVFKHYESVKKDGEASTPTKIITLYGYGGSAKVEIQEAFKDTGGQWWLSLGCLDSSGSLDAMIKLKNNGDLYSYAKLKLTPKAVYPSMMSSWNVEPTEILLGPKDVHNISVTFRPRGEDLNLLRRADVTHVGTLNITHGDEPTRWRIRRLYNKMKKTGQFNSKQSESFRDVIYPICKAFPGEKAMNDLHIIHDSVQNLGDLCRGVRQEEVRLTLEVPPDETISLFHDNPDDSQMYYSLCSEQNNLHASVSGASFIPPTSILDSNDSLIPLEHSAKEIMVTPDSVVLSPQYKNEATVIISTSSNVAQPFETSLIHTDVLGVMPMEGMIPAGRGFPLKIYTKKMIQCDFEDVLTIYTKNDKEEVHIKVTRKKR